MFISQPPTPPPPGWQGSKGPAPCVILNPLLISFVCSSVRERSTRDLGMRGLTFALNPVTSALPSPMPGTIHMQATHHQPILLFQLSTPGQAVVSSLKFKSWDEPGHPGPGQTTTDQIWQAVRVWGEGGRGTSVCLLIFYEGQ